MFGDPIAITYNSVSKNLARVSDDREGSNYYLDDGQTKFRLIIRHTIPKKSGDAGETHHARLYVEHYDSEGTYLRTSSPWITIKSMDSPQVTTEAQYATDALAGFLTSGNVGKLLAREN